LNTEWFDFLREMFYTIAWATLFVELADPPQMNILAAAGARGTLHLIHPEGGVAFFEYQIIRSKTVTVSSLLFHPKQCSILFCKSYFSALKTAFCIASSSRGQENGINILQQTYVYIFLYYTNGKIKERCSQLKHHIMKVYRGHAGTVSYIRCGIWR
jgi:hypothetical protein